MRNKPFLVFLAGVALFAVGCLIIALFHTQVDGYALIFAFIFCLLTVDCFRNLIWRDSRRPPNHPSRFLALLFSSLATVFIFIRAAGFEIPNWLIAAHLVAMLFIVISAWRHQPAALPKNPDALQLRLVQKGLDRKG